jgi:bifunctional DNA-binding transcriptional regulator/antitoxin component of YhaV-PrlF toxin-antitoxin module
MMSSVVSDRGQITVDKSARRALRVQPGMVAVQVVVGDHLEVYFLPPVHDRSLFGALRVSRELEREGWEVTRERAAKAIADDAF